MESVYILETGSYLRREGSALKVVKDNKIIDQIPCDNLKRLMLVGYISLSSGVLDFLIQNRVETVFITPTGRFRARLGIDEHRHVALRKAQYIHLSNPEFALASAKRIVEGKVGNMWRFLMLRSRQYNNDALKIGAVKLKSILSLIRKTENINQLRGMEGIAGRIYFEVFGHMIQNPSFSFSGRNRRPPRDPVNAMLSFIYMLLTNEVLSAIKACGLDPYMGALHEIDYGRPSLACDLVEEYRCFLGDRLVLGLINKKMIQADDFVYRQNTPSEYADEAEMKNNRPVEMKPAIARTFIAAYEEMMKRSIEYPLLGKKINYRWLILNQVRQFADALENAETAYQPFEWKG